VAERGLCAALSRGALRHRMAAVLRRVVLHATKQNTDAWRTLSPTRVDTNSFAPAKLPASQGSVADPHITGLSGPLGNPGVGGRRGVPRRW